MNGTQTNEFRDKVIINAVLTFTAYDLDTASDVNMGVDTGGGGRWVDCTANNK